MTDLFERDPVSLAAQVAELERELGLRHRLYPTWIASGRLRQDVADRQIRAMEAAVTTLRLLDARA